MKIDDKLSEVFDIEPIQELSNTKIIDAETGEIIQSSSDKIEQDYDKARTNIHDLLSKGQEALVNALEVAKQSEHPRAFEVVGNLVKQLTDVNQQLIDLHQQKAKLDAPKDGEKKVTNNNAIFVGSTAELTKMIKSMNKGE
jgi:ElaB/YqjD/DUF883 family membrane-anchored ribosome-binding protein